MPSRLLKFVALSALLLATSVAEAEPRPDAIFARHGLGGARACLAFVDADAVEYRKDRWRAAIDELWREDPQFVLDWIIGATAPPSSAVAEAAKQRDCLVDVLVHDAAGGQSRVIVDYQRADASKQAMASLGERYQRSPQVRREIRAVLTESDYRDAQTQGRIWKRKFVFSGRNFNAVSARAGEQCGIEANVSWKPGDDRHRECWHTRLDPIDREREILQASAAPGISRHHWGTDFDFFALNPVKFVTGRHADEYLWMTHNALGTGFFQPYTKRPARGERYMEERWHWSYYPIGQALLEFAAAHTEEVGDALDEQWKTFESRWNPRNVQRPFFTFVREHWQEFMFNVDTSAVQRR